MVAETPTPPGQKHEKVGVDPVSGEAQCSCGELGFDHIRWVLLRPPKQTQASRGGADD